MSVLDAFDLDGTVALITGGSRGIGRAIAGALSDAGADVVIAARDRAAISAAVAEIETAGGNAFGISADLDDIGEVEGLVAPTVDRFGRLDIVVNNVGGTPPRPFLDTSTAMFERAFHFNVTTAFALTRAATPALLDSGGGAVVNISSLIGRRADRGFVAYGTAKGALAHLTRMMAADLSPRIRVNGIAVGSVATEALDTVLTGELRREMEQRTPLGRLGTPEDIALAALYLASPASAFVTGKVLEVDGGLDAPNLSLGLPDL